MPYTVTTRINKGSSVLERDNEITKRKKTSYLFDKRFPVTKVDRMNACIASSFAMRSGIVYKKGASPERFLSEK